VYVDGAVYEGYWFNDLCQGEGKYTWSDGSWFEGTFQSNQMTQGTLKYIDCDECTGKFQENEFIAE